MAAAQHSTIPSRPVLVLGMGLSGNSIVRHLVARGFEVTVADSRSKPPYLDSLRNEFPDLEYICGGLPVDRFHEFTEIVASPGVDIRTYTSAFQPVGDIELFAREARAPVIAVTGSNGKSTVTMLVATLLEGMQVDVLSGGNIGIPALELLEHRVPEIYVLELSSFQLESTYSLAPVAATVLNISEDHMDRYDDLAQYVAAKARVFRGARCAVVNRADKAGIEPPVESVSFGLDAPVREQDFGIDVHQGEPWFVQGSQPLVPCSRLRLAGSQNQENALAAMALVYGAGYTLSDAGIAAMCDYAGLPHRCELVAEKDGIRWINDSKGTNVGATMAAISGLGDRIVLIAGGQGKGADFSPLGEAVADAVDQVILIGEDRDKIAAALQGVASCEMADSLQEAIAAAQKLARSGDTVLFSPACASFDMFDSFTHRGDCFRTLVQEALA